MIRSLSVAIVMTLVMPALTAQGIDFFHGSWEEALNAAEKENKIIFVDCYTTWCGPCKRMARDVFPNKEVGDFYNEHFINVKMDMEKGEGPAFGKKYPVGAYPTLYYIKPDGEVITAQRGARAAKDFLELGKSVLKRVDFSADFKTAYEEGNRDPELILNYVKALNQSNKSSLKIVNDFLRDEPGLDDSVTMAIILEGAKEVDSKPYSLLIDNKKQFEDTFGETLVRETIVAACRQTSRKAVEFEYYALVEQAVDQMKQHAPDEYKTFQFTAPMHYHSEMSDWNAYYPIAEDYVKKKIRKDADQLMELSNNVLEYFKYEPAAVAFAGTLLEDAAKYGDDWSCEYELAKYHYENGDRRSAKKAALKALKQAKDKGVQTAPIENLLEAIDAKK